MLRTLLVDMNTARKSVCDGISVTQIGVYLFRLAHQVRNVLFGRLDQAANLSHLVIEFFRELALLFVAPRLLKLVHLGRR